MRRFATVAAGVFLGLSAFVIPGTANAGGIPPIIPVTPPPPPVSKGQWIFMTNYTSLQTCQGDGQQYVTLVPQDRLARCEASNSTPATYDLWILYVAPR